MPKTTYAVKLTDDLYLLRGKMYGPKGWGEGALCDRAHFDNRPDAEFAATFCRTVLGYDAAEVVEVK